ncbi:MAG: alkaline phosphatase family protein [Lachnospiraceae bacterium]|nr:alkaline phosphatase family protein [Lachnospiraceae bacterium]
MIKTNYDDCIVNLSNSILKHFTGQCYHKTLEEADVFLKKDYKNVVVLVLDAMGKCIIEKNLSENGFFNSHLVKTISSVFPPTTVAATTTLQSGLMPCEHAWLGWDCYYPQIDKNVTTFLNVNQGTDIPAADINVALTYTPYKPIVDIINENGGNAYNAMPYLEPYPDTFEKICDRIRELCKEPQKKYIYAYWYEPDSTMHVKGCYVKDSVDVLRNLEKQVNELTNELENTLLIITADHGHIDAKNALITDYPELVDCLIRMPSIEPRAINLFVKEDKKEDFVSLFNKAFGNDFILLTKQEVIDKHIFGYGNEHKYFKDMLGDYLAIGTGKLGIFNTKEEYERFIGHHAGMSYDELLVPLIVVETEKN